MFIGDNPPAHVHLLGPGFKVSIEVATLETKGRADVKMVAEAKSWIVKNREYIILNPAVTLRQQHLKILV